MSRWNRDSSDIQKDIAYAVGEDLDIITYLRQRHRLNGWNGERTVEGGEEQ